MPKRKRNYCNQDVYEPPVKRSRPLEDWIYGAKAPVKSDMEKRVDFLESRVQKLEKLINDQFKMNVALDAENFEAVQHIYW